MTAVLIVLAVGNLVSALTATTSPDRRSIAATPIWPWKAFTTSPTWSWIWMRMACEEETSFAAATERRNAVAKQTVGMFTTDDTLSFYHGQHGPRITQTTRIGSEAIIRVFRVVSGPKKPLSVVTKNVFSCKD